MVTSELAGASVMVIDDSNTIRRSAEMFLQQSGCKVYLAQDGFEALEKVAGLAPDLIFVDILMPRLDGFQTCALIRRHGRHRTTPVVMLSSKDSIFDRARARLVGFDQHLPKPFSKADLVAVVKEHLDRRAAARTQPLAA